MAENTDDPVAADDTVVGDPAPVPASPTPRLVDRVWSFRAMVAVALASLVLGGGIGSAIAAVSSDGDDDGPMRMSRFSDGPGERGRPFLDGPRMQGGPGGRGLPNAPGDIQQFREQMREQLKEMRKEFRDQRKDLRRDRAPGTPPTPSPSPETTG